MIRSSIRLFREYPDVKKRENDRRLEKNAYDGPSHFQNIIRMMKSVGINGHQGGGDEKRAQNFSRKTRR
jgi:hypothetical protein